jgi:hypothetical protein
MVEVVDIGARIGGKACQLSPEVFRHVLNKGKVDSEFRIMEL